MWETNVAACDGETRSRIAKKVEATPETPKKILEDLDKRIVENIFSDTPVIYIKSEKLSLNFKNLAMLTIYHLKLRGEHNITICRIMNKLGMREKWFDPFGKGPNRIARRFVTYEQAGSRAQKLYTLLQFQVHKQ